MKKSILPLLIVVLISTIIVGKVLADSSRAGQYLDLKEYVWVGPPVFDREAQTESAGGDANLTDLKPIALTGKLSKVLPQKEYALSLAIEQTVATLTSAKRVSTLQAKQFFSEAIKLPAKSQVLDGNRVLAKTGGSGIVEFEAEKGRYALQIAPVASVNLNLPSSVKVDLDEYIIPIGINRNGDGTVKRIALGSGIKEASAQESVGNSKVKVALYHDKNNNGRWDSDENIAPWAGVRVDLVNLAKQSGINLSDEWKDIYLDNARSGMKASDLVNDLSANCPTAGVSYVDGDTRKTFLKREGQVFGSSDDFEITPGRIYSIKGCDVPFYIIGYDVEKQFEK